MKEPEVKLIDYTGKGSRDPYYAAKKLIYVKSTRLEQNADTWDKIHAMNHEEMFEQLDYIAKTIRSSWEFVSFTFQISNVTRAFTHQFVRTRTASYAQQSMRTVDVSEEYSTRVPHSVSEDAELSMEWGKVNEIIKSSYQKMVAMGIPVQDARGILPTNIQGNICAEINLRTLADLIPKRSSLRTQDEYRIVAKQMADVVIREFDWVKPFLYPEVNQTPHLDAILAEMLGNSTPVSKPTINAALKELDLLKGVK